RRQGRSDLAIEECTGFDERFEGFWQELKTSPARLLAVRNRETLAWHYRSGLHAGTVRVFAASRQGRLVAYWVVDRKDHENLNLRRLRFVDFQALPGSEHLVETAVNETLSSSRKDIDVMENVGCWLEHFGTRDSAAPFKRKMKCWLFYYKARGAEL